MTWILGLAAILVLGAVLRTWMTRDRQTGERNQSMRLDEGRRRILASDVIRYERVDSGLYRLFRGETYLGVVTKHIVYGSRTEFELVWAVDARPEDHPETVAEPTMRQLKAKAAEILEIPWQ